MSRRNRQTARLGWESHPYSVSIDHNGVDWIIKFTAQDDDPEIAEDQVTGILPGWYDCDTVRQLLRDTNMATANSCTNLEAAIKHMQTNQTKEKGIKKTLLKLIRGTELAKGKVS